MHRLTLWMFCVSLVSGCRSNASPNSRSKSGAPLPPSTHPAPIVITDASDRGELDAAVGKWVRVEGEMWPGKQPQIGRVDVDMPSKPIPGSTSRRIVEVRGPAWAEALSIAGSFDPSKWITEWRTGGPAFSTDSSTPRQVELPL